MLLPRKTIWGILAACFLAFLAILPAKAETIFNENFEAYTVGSELEDTYLWTDDSGTNKHLISDTGPDGHSAYFSNAGTSKSAYSYVSLETYGRVKWCFDYQTYHGYSLWQIYSGTNIVAYWRLGDTAYDPTGSPLMYATSTSNYSEDLAYVVSEAIIPVCIYYDPTTYETAATIGGQYFHNLIPYNGNHGQPTRFEIRDYNYSVTARYSRYDNMTIDSGVPDFAGYGNEDVEVIENPDYNPDLIVEVESEEAIDIAKYKECIIGEDCFWKFGYNSSYDDGTFYLIYDQEPRSRNSALDTVALGTKIIRSDRFEVPAATSTGIVDYCVFLENVDADLELICGLQVKWYDEYESAALAMQECISTACDDVSTSTDTWWDIDFQGAIECGFRKTTCWLTTPSGAAKIRYREIIGQSGQPGEIEQNFPLSVVAQFRSLFTAASIATTSTSTQYFAPIRVYDPSSGGMRTLAYMFNNKMLENGMGQYYDFYYDWATKILWLFFALYIFNRIYQVINPSAGSLFDLVLPGRKNEEASMDQVSHIEPIDLRKKYPKSNLTIDLRKKRF